jgi:hypothetical protein
VLSTILPVWEINVNQCANVLLSYFSSRIMKKMLIPVVAAGLLLALSSVSATALTIGGSGGNCDDLLGELKCVGGGGGSVAPGSGGGGGGEAFNCTDTDCFSGYTSGGSGGRNHRNSDGTISPGGEGGEILVQQ